MIEADAQRFNDLVNNYRDNRLVICVNRAVDTGLNNLGSILRTYGKDHLDFLSIDIDGLDYEILEALEIRPRVLCVEVNAGHSPDTEARLDRDIAKNNVGQPLDVFVQIAKQKGYDLVCYTGNAFFVFHDIDIGLSIPILSSKQAYQSFLDHLPSPAREWLYLVNLGVVTPHFRYANSYLTPSSLGIRRSRSIQLILKTILSKSAHLSNFFAKAWRSRRRRTAIAITSSSSRG